MTSEPDVAEPTCLQSAVDEFRAHRATIEQAKGVLMQILAIDEDQAFAILNRYSQTANVKLRTFAQRLTEAATADLTPSKSDASGDVMRLLDRLAGVEQAPANRTSSG